MSDIEKLNNDELMQFIGNIDEQIHELQKKITRLNDQLNDTRRELKDCCNGYDKAIALKQQRRSGLEDAIDFSEKRLHSFGPQVRILNIAFSDVKSLLTGRRMQQSEDELNSAIRGLFNHIAELEERVDYLENRIYRANKELEALRAKRWELNV